KSRHVHALWALRRSFRDESVSVMKGEVVSSIHMATTMKTAAGVLDRMWRMLRPHFFPLVPLSPRGLPRQFCTPISMTDQSVSVEAGQAWWRTQEGRGPPHVAAKTRPRRMRV